MKHNMHMDRRAQKLVTVFLGAASFAGGCGTAQPVETPHTPPVIAAKHGRGDHGDVSDAAIRQLALELTSQHLSTDPGELEIVDIEAVRWPDSSIGCPEPGFEYLQVVTPGHLARVRDSGGVVHHVHMSNGRGLVCERRPEKVTEAAAERPRTFTRRQLEALARADLAARLGVMPNEVSVLGSRPVEWPDSALGCEAAGQPSSAGPSQGFVITVAHRGREYSYHSDLHQVVPCPPIESR